MLSYTVYRPTANAKRLFLAGPLGRPIRWRPGSSSHFERDQVLAALRSKRSSILPWGSVLWILFDVESVTRHDMKRHSSPPLPLSLCMFMRVAPSRWAGVVRCFVVELIGSTSQHLYTVHSTIIHQQRGNRHCHCCPSTTAKTLEG